MYAGIADSQGWQFKICKLRKNAHKVRKKFLVFYVTVYVQLLEDRTDTGLCVPLSSISLNCQLITKLETKHILQAQVCNSISTWNETGN